MFGSVCKFWKNRTFMQIKKAEGVSCEMVLKYVVLPPPHLCCSYLLTVFFLRAFSLSIFATVAMEAHRRLHSSIAATVSCSSCTPSPCYAASRRCCPEIVEARVGAGCTVAVLSCLSPSSTCLCGSTPASPKKSRAGDQPGRA